MPEIFSVLLLIAIVVIAIRNVEFLLAMLMVGQPVLSCALSFGEGLSVGRTELGFAHFAFLAFLTVRVLVSVMGKKHRIILTPAVRFLLIGILLDITVLTIRLIGSPQFDYGLQKLWSHLLFELGGFVLALNIIRSTEQTRKFLWYCIVFGTITAGLIFTFLWQEYGTFAAELRLPQEQMVFHGFRLPTSLSLAYRQAIIAAIAISLVFLRQNRRLLPKIFLYTLSLASLYLVISTATRGALIFLLCTIIIAISFITRRLTPRLVIPLLLVGVSYLMFQITPPEVQSRFREITSEERTPQWQFGLELGINNLLKGVGLGGYGYYEIGPGFRTYPHNLVIEYFAETGIVGLLIILSVTVAGFFRVYRLLRSWPTRTQERVLAVTLISIFLIGFGNSMVSGEIGGSDILWISIGLLFSQSLLEPHAAYRPVALYSMKGIDKTNVSKRFL